MQVIDGTTIHSAHLEHVQGVAADTMPVVLGDDTTESVEAAPARAFRCPDGAVS